MTTLNTIIEEEESLADVCTDLWREIKIKKQLLVKNKKYGEIKHR